MAPSTRQGSGRAPPQATTVMDRPSGSGGPYGSSPGMQGETLRASCLAGQSVQDDVHDDPDDDCDRQVGEDGEEEGRGQHRRLPPGAAQGGGQFVRLAHVPRDDQQNGGQRQDGRKGHQGREQPHGERDEACVKHSRKWRLGPGADVGRRAGDGAGGGYPAEQVPSDIGDSLREEL
eukprot:gene13312-15385_t